MAEIMAQPFNASSVHSFGRKAHSITSKARRQVAHAAGGEGAQIIFTGSGTEANNLAIKGLKGTDFIAVSATEHISVLKPAETRNAILIPVDENGIIRLDKLENILQNQQGKGLASFMLANNETGVIQPVSEIAKIVYEHGGFLHCDAVQAFGKIPVDFNNLNVDMMTVSAHKIGGVQGAAALIMKKGLELGAEITGGGQEEGFRAGTENVAAIAGFGVAAENIPIMKPDLRDYMEEELKKISPDIVIFGENVDRLPNTICVAMGAGKMKSETQLINFDLEGIAVSAGSACSSGKVNTSHVLLAMGVDKEIAETAIRISLGHNTTKPEINRFLEVWRRNCSRVQNSESGIQ